MRPGLGRTLRSTLLVLAVAAASVGGCHLLEQGEGGSSPPQDSEAEWATLKAREMAGVRTTGDWTPPKLLEGGINSAGWEDSPNIAPEGDRILFAYFPGDLMNWIAKDRAHPGKFHRHERGPRRGVTPEFTIDILVSTKQRGKWTEPATHPVSKDTEPSWQAESGPFIAADGSLYYNCNHPATETDYDADIYRDGERLPFNTQAEEHDPCFVSGELFFWKERPGGKKDIYVTQQTGEGGWTDPAPLPAPVNLSGSSSWQPFLTPEGLLYFSSDRDDWMSIYVSRRKGPREWEPPERVVWPSGDGAAVAVTEPSLTSDGRHLYFAVLFKNPKGQFDLDLAQTRLR